MHIKQLKQANGPQWEQAMALYVATFPQWEREAITSIEDAVNSGSSRAVAICKGDDVVGLSLTELYSEQSFALLGYLFIDAAYQGMGFGQRLCDEVFTFFTKSQSLKWLLVEAEAGPEQFYRKLGFVRFDIEYVSPHYDDDQATPMALMSYPKNDQRSLDVQSLSEVVRHIYSKSYDLRPEDPRLKQQLENILSKDVL